MTYCSSCGKLKKGDYDRMRVFGVTIEYWANSNTDDEYEMGVRQFYVLELEATNAANKTKRKFGTMTYYGTKSDYSEVADVRYLGDLDRVNLPDRVKQKLVRDVFVESDRGWTY